VLTTQKVVARLFADQNQYASDERQHSGHNRTDADMK
jgi:hypothetical protein